MLERIGVSLEDELLAKFDRLIAEKGYATRSEAIRDLIRDALVQRSWSESDGREERVAVVTLVYDHDSSSLAQKLAHIQHENHKAVVSALHVHMDEHNCLEVLVLRGQAVAVSGFQNQLLAFAVRITPRSLTRRISHRMMQSA